MGKKERKLGKKERKMSVKWTDWWDQGQENKILNAQKKISFQVIIEMEEREVFKFF